MGAGARLADCGSGERPLCADGRAGAVGQACPRASVPRAGGQRRRGAPDRRLPGRQSRPRVPRATDLEQAATLGITYRSLSPIPANPAKGLPALAAFTPGRLKGGGYCCGPRPPAPRNALERAGTTGRHPPPRRPQVTEPSPLRLTCAPETLPPLLTCYELRGLPAGVP